MNGRLNKRKKHARRGVTLILGLVFLILMFAMVAFAVDMGYVVLVRTQLQVAADSAAMAAAAEKMGGSLDEVVRAAQKFSVFHIAGAKKVEVNQSDVKLGIWDFDRRSFTPGGSITNAVRVTTRRDDTVNGKSPLFFGKVIGINSIGLKTKAVAALVDNFSGFRQPSTGENLPILPIAFPQTSWDNLLSDNGTDEWTWNPDTGQIEPGPDGIPETNVYPQDTGAAGNSGTVHIGGGNNGTADMRRQITDGINSADLSYHGGELELDDSGQLTLNGDPGISAGIKDALASIQGQSRIVPIYDQVQGGGNNAVYTVVEFASIRIMEVRMTGNRKDKRVIVQQADMVIRGGIPSSESNRTSHSIYSPVCLVQ